MSNKVPKKNNRLSGPEDHVDAPNILKRTIIAGVSFLVFGAVFSIIVLGGLPGRAPSLEIRPMPTLSLIDSATFEDAQAAEPFIHKAGRMYLLEQTGMEWHTNSLVGPFSVSMGVAWLTFYAVENSEMEETVIVQFEIGDDGVVEITSVSIFVPEEVDEAS